MSEEERLGQVAWEALGHVERWRTVPLLMGGQQYAVMAAAVEAEVLRRAVAYLEARRQATGDDPLVQQEYEHAAERVREYAEQQREG